HGDAFENLTVCVTGGAGFIGSHLAHALVILGADVRVIDDLSGGDTENFTGFSDKITFIEGTILDEKLLNDAFADCRYVFHQAALGSVPASVERPRAFYDANA